MALGHQHMELALAQETLGAAPGRMWHRLSDSLPGCGSLPPWPSHRVPGPANSTILLFQRVERVNSLLSVWAHTGGLSALGFDWVFKSLLVTSQNLSKNNYQAANPDFQIRKYSLIYELCMLGVTDKASSLITSPLLSSPLLCAWFHWRWGYNSTATLTLAARSRPWDQWAPMPGYVNWRDVLLNTKLWPELLLVKFHSEQTPGFIPRIGPLQTVVYPLRIILQIRVAPNPKWKVRFGLHTTNVKALLFLIPEGP